MMQGEMLVVVVASLLTIGAATRLLAPIARGLGERLKRGGGGPDVEVLRQEMDGLRETLQQACGDVADLQERVDFAERLLAQQREAARLSGK